MEVHVSAGPPELGAAPPEFPPPGSTDQAPSAKTFDKIEFGGIDWLVLDKNGDMALLLSEKVLFRRAYNDTYEVKTWEVSTLREYLNNDFLNEFSPEDRARIAETMVINDDNAEMGTSGGNDTMDRIFLLSEEEVQRYFDRIPARFATDESGERSTWWLRSPGTCAFTALAVSRLDGSLAELNVSHSGISVRIALWLLY